MKKFLVWVVLCLSYQVTNAQLSGNYTIGGTTPDYPTIAAAVNDLQTLGVTGPVTFKLRNGTYFEQINLTGWTGMSSTNPVTFESESGDSSLVNWEYWGANNYSVPLFMDGVYFVKVSTEGREAVVPVIKL